jgi:3-methylfumaryl-CoA hydratase
LCFVSVEHAITTLRGIAIRERQDIVYRDVSGAAPAAAAKAPPPAPTAKHRESHMADPVLLFRYSALTFNGHRIHYDQAYARQEEGYRDLVVHGPLTATLLQQLAVEQGGGRRLAAFEFRGVSPLFVDRAFRLEGHALADGSLALWARGPDGELAMSATAAFD